MEIAGTTGTDCSYTGQYVPAVEDSVCWAATFRLRGIYQGTRHGRVFGVAMLSAEELCAAVREDIEKMLKDMA